MDQLELKCSHLLITVGIEKNDVAKNAVFHSSNS